MTGTIWLVCGSRTFTDYDLMRRALDGLAERYGAPATIVNGAMMGADAMSSFWAYERKIDTDPFGAKWGQFGGAAGPIRNTAMADRLARLGVDRCMAFTDKPLLQSRGTRDMHGKAVKIIGASRVHHFQQVAEVTP